MLKIRTDSFVAIGKQHFNCEDYVFTPPGSKAVFLSDGCSGSPHTDIGARLLCHSGMHTLRNFMWNGKEDSYKDIGYSTILKASDLLSNFSDIPSEALDATLIIAFVSVDNSRLYVNIYGDGNVAFKFKEFPPIIFNYSFLGNAPYYLNYILPRSHSRLVSYQEMMGEGETLSITKDWSGFEEAGSIITRKYNFPTTHEFNIKDLEMVAIMSDGVESFFNVNTREHISTQEVITNLLDFKTLLGDFVKRRVRAVVKRYAKDGTHHGDDLSIAVMLFEEN